MARLDGCSPGPENETVVLCHAPYHGRHGSRKSDEWGAACCASCHSKLDGVTPWDRERGRIMYGPDTCESAQAGFEKIETWFHAIHEWQALLIEHGYVVIAT